MSHIHICTSNFHVNCNVKQLQSANIALKNASYITSYRLFVEHSIYQSEFFEFFSQDIRLIKQPWCVHTLCVMPRVYFSSIFLNTRLYFPLPLSDGCIFPVCLFALIFITTCVMIACNRVYILVLF